MDFSWCYVNNFDFKQTFCKKKKKIDDLRMWKIFLIGIKILKAELTHAFQTPNIGQHLDVVIKM